MTGFAIRSGAVGLGFVALTALGSSQTSPQPPQQQPPVFRGGANVVRVDVTVTNRRGEQATDLTRDDFAVTEDGAPQTIDSFELVHVTGAPNDDRDLEIHSTSQASTEAARDDVRLFLIFWDEYHIGEFIPASRAREVLTGLVRTGFGPTDLVGIMDQLTTVDSIRFTRDRMALADQVHALKGRLGVFMPPRGAVEEAHLQQFRDIGRLRNQVTTSALNAAAAFLGNFREGRKALLFVSQGFPLYGRGDESDRYTEIVRTANTNNTAIYTLDPSSEVGRRPGFLDVAGGRDRRQAVRRVESPGASAAADGARFKCLLPPRIQVAGANRWQVSPDQGAVEQGRVRGSCAERIFRAVGYRCRARTGGGGGRRGSGGCRAGTRRPVAQRAP